MEKEINLGMWGEYVKNLLKRFDYEIHDDMNTPSIVVDNEKEIFATQHCVESTKIFEMSGITEKYFNSFEELEISKTSKIEDILDILKIVGEIVVYLEGEGHKNFSFHSIQIIKRQSIIAQKNFTIQKYCFKLNFKA